MAEKSTPRDKLLTRWGQLKTERATWWAHWKEISDYLLPRSGRFFVDDRNRGDKRHNNIYDSTGTEFARHGDYSAEGREVPSLSAEHAHYNLSTLHMTQPIVENGNAVGVLDLDLDLRPLYLQVFAHGSITVIAAALALLLATVTLRRLNAAVLRPLSTLSTLMERVAHTEDYAARAEPSAITELDALASGFNRMLGQIADRDARLAAHIGNLKAAFHDTADIQYRARQLTEDVAVGL